MTATTVPTTQHSPVDPLRRTALIAGVLYLLTFLSAIPAVFLLAPVLDNPHYIVSAGSDTRVVFGSLLDLVNAAACIGTAVVLFPVLRRQHEAAALGFVTARVFEAAVIVIGVVSLLSVVTLRQAAGDLDPAYLMTAGRSLVTVRDWTFLLGPGLIPGVNALLLGYLMYRSGLVPRGIPTLGLIGGPLLIASAIATMFGVNQQISVWSAIAVAPIFFWELSLGVWLTVKGFNTTSTVLPELQTEPAALAIA
jgi:hypothetical protein